jgi:hypothetical protein
VLGLSQPLAAEPSAGRLLYIQVLGVSGLKKILQLLPLQYQPGCPGLFRKKMELPGGRPKRDKTRAPPSHPDCCAAEESGNIGDQHHEALAEPD